MSAMLAQIAAELEEQAAFSTSANPNEAGYWKRIATALEVIADATTVANNNQAGYMLRAAIAAEVIGGTSGAEENANRAGYLKRLADALEAANEATYAGSVLERFRLGAIAFVAGEPGAPSALTLDFSQDSNSQYLALLEAA